MAKHAFLLLSHPERPGKFANPLTYAKALDAAGHDVAVYFDGAATYWFDGIDDHPEPARQAYEEAKERGLIAGVCDHCATYKGGRRSSGGRGLRDPGDRTRAGRGGSRR